MRRDASRGGHQTKKKRIRASICLQKQHHFKQFANSVMSLCRCLKTFAFIRYFNPDGIHCCDFSTCLSLVHLQMLSCGSLDDDSMFTGLRLKGGRVGVLSRHNCRSGVVVRFMDNQIANSSIPELLWLLQQILWALRQRLCGSGENPTHGNPWVVVSDDDRASATASEPSRPAAAGAASRPAAAGAASWSVPPGFSSATPEPRYTCPNQCKYCHCQCCRGEEVGHRHCRCHYHRKWR